MPFGLVNALFTFQRIMNHVFKDMLWKVMLVYIDDILVFSNSEEDHIRGLKEVFDRLNNYGLHIKPKKCHFGMREVDFLGIDMGSDGRLKISEGRRKQAWELKVTENLKELRSLLGFTSFFKKFVPDYFTITKPLLESLKKNSFKIEDEQRMAVKRITEAIGNANELILPDFNDEFKLYTDASGESIGAVLTQELENEEIPIAWISRPLVQTERNYTVTEKECLAVVWDIEKFKAYLYKKFTLFTDHSALKWLLKPRESAGRIARWIMKLQSVDFEIIHIRGTNNGFADALSRGVIKEVRIQIDDQELKVIGSGEEVGEVIRSYHRELGHAGAEATRCFMANKESIN